MDGLHRDEAAFFDVAHEGAQIRAVAQALRGGALAEVAGIAPRSVVVLAADQVAEAAARAAVAWLAPLAAPVVVARTLPAYVGPLDVAVVVGGGAELGGESGGEDALRGLSDAAGRGAETVLAGPRQGMLIDEAPHSTARIPALPGAGGSSPARAASAVAAVVQCLHLEPDLVAERLELLADEVDAELEACAPARGAAVNPARQLSAAVEGARVAHTGVGPRGAALAELVAAVWTVGGAASSYIGSDELPAALERDRERNQAGPGPAADDIFYDPYVDGPPGLVGLTTVAWSVDPLPPAVSAGVRVETAAPETGDETARGLRLLARAYAATALSPHSEGTEE